MKQIPNLFTLLNLFFGCLAIVFVFQNEITVAYDITGQTQYISIPEKIWLASLFIGLAAGVDFLDGFVARLFKATSAMGRELDSLADLVSFGVAPGMIIYQFLRLSLMQESGALSVSFAWLLPALVIPCAAAYRLAKFNLDESQQYVFKGVPSPAAGLLIASFPLIYWNSSAQWLVHLFLNKWVWYIVIFVISYLMVCNWPLMSLKFKDRSLKNNGPKILLLALAIIGILFLQWAAIPVLFVCYILLSVAMIRKTEEAAG